jgi:hypothetical protein
VQLYVAASEGLVTVEFTRHPESKGLRGLMKMVDRQDHADGYKLVYAADWRETTEGVLGEYVKKEATWRSSRAKS